MIIEERGDRPARWPHRGRRAIAARLAVVVAAAAVTGGLVAPALAIAADPVIPAGAWTDDFSAATLDSRWSVYNEDTTALSLADGKLKIDAQSGDTWQTSNTARNIVVVDVPDSDFTATARVDLAVVKQYQGAGLIAWKDIDNYIRSGVTYIGSLNDQGPIAIETDVETAAVFGAVNFKARPATTGENLRMQRVGDVITTSYWDGTAWVTLTSQTVTFPVQQVGLFALGAQDGTRFAAAFDDFSIVSADGAAQVPTGNFTLAGSDPVGFLVAGTDGALSVQAERPSSSVTFTATAADGSVTLVDSSGRPLVVGADGRAILGAVTDVPTPVRLVDAGGGKILVQVGDRGPLVANDQKTLVLGAHENAARFVLTSVSSTDAVLEIDGDGKTVDISDTMYGIFYEDINYAADGGLYAELVRNRSFEFNTSDNASFTSLTAWSKVDSADGAATLTVKNDDGRLNTSNRNYVELSATGVGAGLRNAGFNTGIALKQSDKYDFTVWARSAAVQILTVNVQDAAGTTIFAQGTINVDASGVWKKYAVTLTADATTAAGRVAVLAGSAGTIALDEVSLFPQDTWVGPVSGKKTVFRKDLAEKIAALNPSFLRFPGGCVTNAGTFDSYADSNYTDRQRTYQWKETLGPVEERATNYNFWGYNQTYGIGYLEYFELAEELGATPLPVVSVGANGCGSTLPELKSDRPELMAQWVDDTADIVEFANGDVATEWGAKRAALGHPEPFNLKYIGLGNEENTTTFEANFPGFRDAVVARANALGTPVQIISNSGPDSSGSRFETLWAYNRAQKVDLVDEHYYRDPSWFLANATRYDSYDRSGPKVFLGEYASKGNTWWNALSEAAYMTHLERNADVVRLASYAPLLSNEDYVQWSPDAIWFDNDESWTTPNYYVQEVFADNVGQEVVPSTLAGTATTPPSLEGGIFLSTWATAAQYDDVKVTSNADNSVLFSDDFATDASQWSPVAGTWSATDGRYTQASTSVTDARSVITGAYTKDWSNYTMEVTARKTAGSEGFVIGFAAGAANNYFWWNIGGWSNTRSVLQKADGGSANEVSAVEGLGVVTGQDYKLKIEVSGRTIKLYMDGVLKTTYTDPVAASPLYQVVTRDTVNHELIAKLVNTSNDTVRTTLRTTDVALAGTAKVTEMTGARTATNTKASKQTVFPAERTITGVSENMVYDLQPNSVTFIRLAVKDGTPPVIDSVAVTGAHAGDWYAAGAVVTAAASDDRKVAKTEVSVDGGAWQSAVGPSASVTLTTNGIHTVSARAVDAEGNTSPTRPQTVAIDTKAPVSLATLIGRSVAIRAADAGAGVAKIEYRTTASQPWQVYSAPVVVGNAATIIWYRATDKLGLTEDAATIVVPASDSEAGTTAVVGTATQVTYGKTGSVSVRVLGTKSVPTGTVRVQANGVLLGSGTLKNGRVSVSVAARSLPVGTHQVTVSYSGDTANRPGQDTLAIKVVKATSKAKVSAKVVRSGSATKARSVRATVTVRSSTAISGKVRVRVVNSKGKTLATKAVKVSGSSTAKVRITLPKKLSPGKYKVTAQYLGSATVSSSKTVTTSVRVR